MDQKIRKQLQRYYSLWKESNAIYEEWAREHGLSSNSLLVLYSFCDGVESCTQKEICQKWYIPKQTVNTILKEFERQGYVELLPAEEDKRNKLVRLTPEGKRFCDSIISGLYGRELRVMERMGAEQIKRMNDSLALFIELFREGEGESRG